MGYTRTEITEEEFENHDNNDEKIEICKNKVFMNDEELNICELCGDLYTIT